MPRRCQTRMQLLLQLQSPLQPPLQPPLQWHRPRRPLPSSGNAQRLRQPRPRKSLLLRNWPPSLHGLMRLPAFLPNQRKIKPLKMPCKACCQPNTKRPPRPVPSPLRKPIWHHPPLTAPHRSFQPIQYKSARRITSRPSPQRLRRNMLRPPRPWPPRPCPYRPCPHRRRRPPCQTAPPRLPSPPLFWLKPRLLPRLLVLRLNPLRLSQPSQRWPQLCPSCLRQNQPLQRLHRQLRQPSYPMPLHPLQARRTMHALRTMPTHKTLPTYCRNPRSVVLRQPPCPPPKSPPDPLRLRPRRPQSGQLR